MSEAVGILSSAVCAPGELRPTSEILAAAGVNPTSETVAGLGAASVSVGSPGGEPFVLHAARQVLEQAGVAPGDVDAIVDYSVLPQKFLVPAWSPGNQLQAELGAKGSFTVGFSGGGSSNLLVALASARDLILTDADVSTVLLFGADFCIPGDRLLGGAEPIAVLADAATALLVSDSAPRNHIGLTELWSDGALHDVLCVPGGAMRHPDRADLFRLQLDREAHAAAPRMDMLLRLVARVLELEGLSLDAISRFVIPNLSPADRAEFADAFGIDGTSSDTLVGGSGGHLLAGDLARNLHELIESESGFSGPTLLCSHGLGFLYGATVIHPDGSGSS